MFISFEGIDGSGKSTQIKKLKAHLENEGAHVKTFREPGGTVISEKIRQILLDPNYEINAVTELLLFSAARSQLMVEKVIPSLREGAVVILDRFYDSTTAYQGYGRQSVSLEEINAINAIASHKLAPDLTIYMKISLEDAHRRMAQKKDRMEQAGNVFFKKVIQGFDELAKTEDRFFTVDATRSPEEVQALIWKQVQAFF